MRPGATAVPGSDAAAAATDATLPTPPMLSGRPSDARSRRPPTATPDATTEPMASGRPDRTAAATPRSEVTARAVAFVADHRPGAEAFGADLAELIQDPDAFANALTAGLQRLADPEYLEGQRRIAPGIGAVYGVRWPLMAAVSRGFRNATKRDRPASSPVHRRSAVPRGPSRASVVRLRSARTNAGQRDRADVAAPSPCGSRGRRLDHGRLARPSVRQGHRRRAVSLGRAGAARVLPESLGASARRFDHRDDDARRSSPRPDAGRCPPRARSPRPAHRRRRARRPEGTRLGVPLARVRGHRRDHRSTRTTRRPAPSRRRTATAPG